MLTESDRAILDETYRSCRMGTDAIRAAVSKVTNENLALELNRQSYKYAVYGNKTVEKLEKEYEIPRKNLFGKVKVWMGIRMNTLKNTSNVHVVQLLIRENTSAITGLMKTVKRNKDAKKEYCELAEELMDFEEKCIESLKAYLK